METIQFIQTTPEKLQNEISRAVEQQLNKFLEVYKPKQPEDYLTRLEVAELLRVDVSTIHNWCKAGILKPKKLGNRVYFLRREIESSFKDADK